MADAALVATGTPTTLAATEGASTGTQVVASFSDPGTDGTAADYTATLSWGDGSTSTGSITAAGGTSFTVSGSHSYAEEGSYPVTVTIQDVGGSSLSTSTTTFRVSRPVLKASNNSSNSTSISLPISFYLAGGPNSATSTFNLSVLPTFRGDLQAVQLSTGSQTAPALARVAPADGGGGVDSGNPPPGEFRKPPAEDSSKGTANENAPKEAEARPAAKGASSHVAIVTPPAVQAISTTSVSPNAAAGLPPEQAPKFRLDLLRVRLDAMKHEFEMERASTSQTLVLTGIFASAGYVLLSSRAGLWVLAALTAGPLWKQFDPIVLVSGRKEEKERERAGGEPQEEEEETLQSLVR